MRPRDISSLISLQGWVIYTGSCDKFILRTEKVGIAKDWGSMVYETAWYRGRTPGGLQVGEPYPSTQVNHRTLHLIKNVSSSTSPKKL